MSDTEFTEFGKPTNTGTVPAAAFRAAVTRIHNALAIIEQSERIEGLSVRLRQVRGALDGTAGKNEGSA